MLDRRFGAPVPPGVTPNTPSTVNRALRREQLELTRRAARGPEVEDRARRRRGHGQWRARGALRSRDRRSRRLRGSGPRTRRRTPSTRAGLAGRSDAAIRANTSGLVTAPEQPEPALAQADGGVELARRRRGRVRRAPRTRPATPPPPRASRASCTNSGEWSTPTTSIPRRASASAWRPGPHPTSSTRIPGSSAERLDQELDLLLRPLRERHDSAGIRRPVRLTELLGDRIEPSGFRAAVPDSHAKTVTTADVAPLSGGVSSFRGVQIGGLGRPYVIPSSCIHPSSARWRAKSSSSGDHRGFWSMIAVPIPE